MKTRHSFFGGFFFLFVVLVFSACDNMDRNLIPYQYPNGKYGYVDENGKEVIDGKYDSAKKFREGLAAVSMGELFGYINKNGKIVIPLQYTSASNFVNGIALVSKAYKFGCINPDNKEIIPCEYDYLMKTEQDSLLLKGSKNRLEGFIQLDGKVVIPFEYDEIQAFYDGEAYVVKNGKKGIIRANGEVVVPCIYDEIKSYYENLYLVTSNGLYGFLNSQKQEILPCEYGEHYAIGVFSDIDHRVIRLKKGDRYGLMDSNGNVLTPCKYDDIGGYLGGQLAFVSLNGKIGYVDRSGKEKIAPVYDFSRDAGECYILCQNGKYGLANRTSGQVLMNCMYDRIELETENLFMIVLDGKRGLANMEGEVVLKPEYESIGRKFMDHDFFELTAVTPEGRYFRGLARYADGKLIVPANKYLSIGHFDKGNGQYAEVELEVSKRNYRKGIINREGKEVVSCEYMYTYIVEDGYCVVKPYNNNGQNIRVKLNE